MALRICATPGCTLPDFHDGACSHWQEAACSKRDRAVTPLYTPEAELHARGIKRPRATALARGHVHEVDRLLAVREGKGGREFVVRWQGQGAVEDTWEPERNIGEEAIEEFERVPMLRAPWVQRRATATGLYLVEQVLARRVSPVGTAQSKVRWHGFSARWDAWVDDDALVKPPLPARVEAVAELEGVAELEARTEAPASMQTRAEPSVPIDRADCARDGRDMTAVRHLLRDYRLEGYGDAFDEFGFDDLEFLRTLAPATLASTLEEHVGMKPGHAAKFVAYFLGSTGGRLSPADAPAMVRAEAGRGLVFVSEEPDSRLQSPPP
jgi:hypothetical protein